MIWLWWWRAENGLAGFGGKAEETQGPALKQRCLIKGCQRSDKARFSREWELENTMRSTDKSGGLAREKVSLPMLRLLK